MCDWYVHSVSPTGCLHSGRHACSLGYRLSRGLQDVPTSCHQDAAEKYHCSEHFCCCTASMEQATDGAETTAIDGLVSSWSENIFVSFCLRTSRYGLTLWCALGLLVGAQYKCLSYSSDLYDFGRLSMHVNTTNMYIHCSFYLHIDNNTITLSILNMLNTIVAVSLLLFWSQFIPL